MAYYKYGSVRAPRAPETVPNGKADRLDDPETRHSYVECRVASTIVNGPDGRPAQLTFGDPGYIDYFGRPWAQNWEEHFEKGWEKPKD